MHAHIIPCRRLLRVAVPRCAYISMVTGENYQHIFIMHECLMMVSISHYMTAQYFPAVLLFDKYRHLCSNRFVLRIAPGQESKRMLVDKFFNYLFISFFVMREVVH